MARILIVEDSPTQAEQLRLILGEQAYETQIAVSAEIALDLFDQSEFDVVLSDVVMPGMSGYELCRQIKALPRGKETPVVLLTTLNLPMDVIRGLECGADNFITKPYEPEYLLSRLKAILANKAIRSERKVRVGIDLELMGTQVTITSEREQILDALISTFEELVRAKEREHLISVSQESTRKSLEFLQSTVDALSVAIAILDRDGAIVMINAAWHDFVQLNPVFSSLTGPGTDYVATCGNANQSDARELAVGICEVANHQRADWSGELGVRKGDVKRTYLVRASRFTVPDGVRVVVMHTDISALRETEEALRESDRRFHQAQKLEAIGLLAGGIAHDFNNILTGIIGFAKFIDREPLSSRSHEDLQKLIGLADRAANLIHQLLAFSRKQSIKRDVLQLTDTVRGFVGMLGRVLGDDIEISMSLDADTGLVRADPGQIEQVILNLSVNARDAMPHGGKLTIETRNVTLNAEYARTHPSVAPGAFVMLAVSDTGCGMDHETMQKIFEPFFTTKGVGQGTGLGLSTVYGIVKQHEGNIWVYSEPGRGTSFKIYFPRVEESTKADHAVPPAATRHVGSETILLVEDEPTVRDITVRILEEAGYQVLAAASPDQAEAIFRQSGNEIDLLVTDVVMPGGSGPDLYERLHLLIPSLHVVFTSGYTANHAARQQLNESDVSFVEKPYDALRLLKTIRAALDNLASRNI